MLPRLPPYLVLALLLSGCATVIIPPANPDRPATVYLLDSGRTSSLIIPNESGTLTRYTYGDWDWYALRKTEWWRAVPALLWPTQGALGRMELTGSDDLAHLSGEAQNWYTFEVSRDRALALAGRLDAEFQREQESLVHTPSVGLDFVHHGHWYCAVHNSNHATVGWLHDLGVRTRGYPAWSAWIVRQTAKPTRGSASPGSHP